MSLERSLAIGVSAVVILAVVAGLVVLGWPAEERSRMLDARRVEDLSVLTQAVRRHYRREGTLPERIEDIHGGVDASWLQDPRTGAVYSYRVVDGETFELCADFEQVAARPHWPVPRDDEPFRFHEAGPQCFEIPVTLEADMRQVDPARR